MPYIDTSKAQQIISIAKDYIGTQFSSFVNKDANGCGGKSDWNDLLCFYELYRLANHRISEYITDDTYQTIIQSLLSRLALTPNYSLATCNTNVIIANGGCGCGGGSTTTGIVAGCVDSVLPFHMDNGQASYQNPFLIGSEILVVLRNGIGMSLYPSDIQGFIFDTVTGTFVPNGAISDQGEDFVILYKKCNGSGGGVIPTTGLVTGRQLFNGDGITTTFNIPHGFTPFTPSFYIVGGGSAFGAYTYFPNAVAITVEFDVAPITGSNNIVLTWAARI